ncbi:hypothetical protein A2J03_08085 [Rhodococcus sp. EPR-157]|uniref:hypothetical protein n=1 Tax=Rhodococcus sp. EPR-157 TaxID=1813677 RepID=UPI0007BB12BA|nr:hypothetical protein [Rhodococcus sp. EPR-157]KZF03258.1 hypothetical protein A2J03_08085 [Rhodococcus sp. EPR-157]
MAERPEFVSADAVHHALAALGIPAIGLHSVHINRIDGTVRVENLATDEAGVYRIDGTEFVTESITLEVV